MKNRSFLINFLIFTFWFIIIIGLIIYAFWYFRILKQPSEPTPLMLDLRRRIEFVNNYSFKDANYYLKNLPVETLILPLIKNEEIGRDSLF